MKRTLAAVLSMSLFAAPACQRKAADPAATQSEATAAARPPHPAEPAFDGPAPAKPIAIGGDPIAEGNRHVDHGTNPMVDTAGDPLSTFAIDVDTASYALARRTLLGGALPPAAAVRVEEFVNYFHYGYAGPDDGSAFAVHLDGAPSPFTAGRTLLRVGVQAKQVAASERKRANLVFLVDVSGSMSGPDRLGLAKRALGILVDHLSDGDTVALVTYAGSTRVALEPTGLSQKADILTAIDELDAGGSTAMGSGIDLAYRLAARGLGEGATSRVIVLSDGDANVGASSHEQLLATIADQVRQGVTLTTVGFGVGNYRDDLMEQLADRGNGQNLYVDSLAEARRVFHEQLGGTLEVVAKDVKIQVEFDPAAVARYRLIGYENRDLADADFRDDAVDAGEIGAGHTVTALYEVELTSAGERLATVRLRAKAPGGGEAAEQRFELARHALAARFDDAAPDLRFATAVAALAEILRGSSHAAGWSLDEVRRIAAGAAGESPERAEFVALIDAARLLRGGVTAAR